MENVRIILCNMHRTSEMFYDGQCIIIMQYLSCRNLKDLIALLP